VEFRILGPVEVLDARGRRLALGGPKQRALLAVLLLHAGQVVAVERLVDELWGEDPPEGAAHILQVQVANLRKVLEPDRARRAAARVLHFQPPGYLIDPGPDGLDLTGFERLTAQGRVALAGGDPTEAARLLRRGLDLWRGPALGGVVLAASGQGERVRLEERRLAAIEDRLEAELALGRHRELIGELEALVAAHPLRERLHGQRILALYRSGRQAEALDAYRRTRETLAEELGIDPSRPLQELERAVLAQDPGLDWSPRPQPAAPVAASVEPTRPPAGPVVADRPVDPAATARAPAEERKVVTVVSCGLVGAGGGTGRADPEDVRARLQPCRARVRAELERFGGTIERLVGTAVMAVFGAPLAHEDDPERAVRAALRALQAIGELNRADPGLEVSLRVGVCTGEALVTVGDQAELGDGIVTGAVVDAAISLQLAAAVDDVLVDEATFRATDRAIVYRQAATDPSATAVWRPVAPAARLEVDLAQAPGTPLVARDRELHLLLDALARARDEHSPQLVTLVGVPGIGKTRLVLELGRRVEAESELTTWRQGRCLPYGDGVALWALGEIVKAQAGIADADPAEEATAKLQRAVGNLVPDQREAGWVGGHLGPLIGLTGTAELGGDRRVEAFAAWRRFLEALAEQRPAVLVVEDLHWADDALLDFLDHLVEWAADVPLLVVATTRPELLARRPGWGGGKPNTTTASLAPLSDADTARLLAGLLEQALLPAELQATLLARAGGNPLYAEEYVRMLADRGYLRRTQTGTWRLDRSDELPVPGTVQAIIAARLDALAPADKALLQDAAVLGETGWLGALATLAGEDPWVLEQRLHTLERKEFLRRERRPQVVGERQYAFRHVLIRDVAYGQLPRAVRAERHQRVAVWLQGLSPDRAKDRAEDRAELLAHHWQAALTYARAADQDTTDLAGAARLALRDAGDRALELNAFAVAMRWYAAALELWPRGDVERPWLLLGQGKAQFMTDKAGGALLEDARDGLLAQGRLEAAAEAEALLGQLARLHGQGERAMAHHRQAAALLKGAGPSRAKAFALVSLAGALVQNGRSRDAIRVGRQALAIADALGLDDLRARAHNTIGCARSDSGDPGGAIADLERAVAIAVEASSPQSTDAYGNLATTVIALGDLDRGLELRAKAHEAAERFGLAGDLRWARADQVEADYWRGRWEAARRGADELISDAKADAWQLIEPSCRVVRGKIALARGDLAGALRDAVVAAELAEQTREVHGRIPTLIFQATTLLAAGRVQDAGERASEVLASLVDQNLPLLVQMWSGELAHVLRALGRAAELTDLAATVVTPTPWLQAATAVAAGHLEHAAELYTQIGSLPDAAYARLRAAEQLLAAGRRTESTTQLERARSFYQQVSASAYLREAEALSTASA
jgi:DNA-binding SARP family transcriptional activator/class 3 adenylate cyclase